MARFPLLLSLVFVLLAQAANAQEQPEVYVRTTSNNFFQVAGTDFISVQYVTHMAQEAGEHCADALPLSNALPLPILVELVPPDKVGFDGPYTIRPQPNGDVTVSIRWSEDASFEETCQALASAFLVRSAIWRFGHDHAATVPDWLELAMGLGLEIHLRPALRDELLADSRDTASWPLERIFSLKGRAAFGDLEAKQQCLWLVEFLRNQSPDREHFRRLMAGFLKDLPPIRLLVSAFPDKLTDERAMDIWWAVGYQATVRARQAPFFNMDESLAIMRNGSYLTAEIEGMDVRVGIHELYGYRGNVALAKAARQRVREIKVDLQKINPVYYNALLSMGVVFDSWLVLEEPDEAIDPDEPLDLTEEEIAYEEAYARFENDLQSAQLLDLEIKRLLNW